MTLRSGRAGRPGVIDRPAARSAVVAGSAAAVARGVERRREHTGRDDLRPDAARSESDRSEPDRSDPSHPDPTDP